LPGNKHSKKSELFVTENLFIHLSFTPKGMFHVKTTFTLPLPLLDLCEWKEKIQETGSFDGENEHDWKSVNFSKMGKFKYSSSHMTSNCLSLVLMVLINW